jgi:dipeptidyl aminopeptidase/acylaminoacyl peptidase
VSDRPELGGADCAGEVLPRSLLLASPNRVRLRLDPQGERLAFLAPVGEVLSVWVGPLERPHEARPLPVDPRAGIREFHWAPSGEQILYLQDESGDENWHVYCVELRSGAVRDLTPLRGVSARLERTSWRHPHAALISMNARSPALRDVYRIDLRSGERVLLFENPGWAAFWADAELQVRLALELPRSGGGRLLQVGPDGAARELCAIPAEDVLTTTPLALDEGGHALYLRDSRGRDTAALVRLDLRSGESQLLAHDPACDVEEVLWHPREGRPQAASFRHAHARWQVLDAALQEDFAALAALDAGELRIVSQSLDAQRWIAAWVHDDGPSVYALWDRRARKAAQLCLDREDLGGRPLARMHAISIAARDALPLVSYLTLPPWTDPGGCGRPERALPALLLVHGGPWSRDSWGFDPLTQLLASRGYAVLRVNFRGSTGFGKAFVNAGDRQWGRRMQTDLLDAAAWAVREGIALPERIGIMGVSYGGYAALIGLTLTPQLFRCAVAIAGSSRLATLLAGFPLYWEPTRELFKARIGDWTTEEGRAELEAVSPLAHVDRICRPLLIGQGAHDVRVLQAESDALVAALQARQIPVTYAFFPDEGHGFVRPENNRAFFALVDVFLGQHLGGRSEPIGEDLVGSSLSLRAGAELLPGLAQALERRSAS